MKAFRAGLFLFTAMFWALPAASQTLEFGFAAISCGHDDPHDNSTLTDYADEVAGFTTLNQVCVDSPEVTTARLLASKGRFTPLLAVEPIFFSGGRFLRARPDAAQLWPVYADAIRASGVTPVFYLADEPALRHLPAAELSRAARLIRAEFPRARLAVIEAFLPDRPLDIPAEIDLWGFNAYALPDPGQDAAYLAELDRAQAALLPHQALIIVADAQYTPTHARAGLSMDEMADVALAYERLALSRPRVAVLLGYTWAGGIDGVQEFGVRDMGDRVRLTWQDIGARLTQP